MSGIRFDAVGSEDICHWCVFTNSCSIRKEALPDGVPVTYCIQACPIDSFLPTDNYLELAGRGERLLEPEVEKI